MKISDKGLEALIAEEGEVLRAYKDVAGVWTIGVGLTKASGVIDPKPGMTITKEESRDLLRLALDRSYEYETYIAMSGRKNGSLVNPPRQAEFDAGVSFHFNTGAISRASWVDAWKNKNGRAQILAALRLWNKSGGKVLPALEARRAREGAMLLDGVYLAIKPAPGRADLVRWGLDLSTSEKAAVLAGLQKLGFVQPSSIDISRQEVKDFQRANGLTADGIMGRASLSTLQRLLDAKSKALAPTAAVTVATAVVASGVLDAGASAILPATQADTAALIGAGLWLASHLWSYRAELFGWLKPATNPGA
jgi:lysozyme